MRAHHDLATGREINIDTTPRSHDRRSPAGLYVAAWALLAALALGYMSVLLLQPEWAARMTTQSLRGDPNTVSRTPVQLSTELESLRRTVADLQRELAYVKTATSLRQESEVAGQGRFPLAGTAERPPLPEPRAALLPPAPSPPAGPPAEREAVSAPQPDAADGGRGKPKIVMLNARPTETVKTTETTAADARKPSDQLETGSLPPKPRASFGTATVTPAVEAAAIQLDSGPSLDSLRLRWSVLYERHASTLKDLDARYTVGGSPESPSYQLLAGPFSSTEEAKRVCALLRAKKVPCSVAGAFTGNAL